MLTASRISEFSKSESGQLETFPTLPRMSEAEVQADVKFGPLDFRVQPQADFQAFCINTKTQTAF